MPATDLDVALRQESRWAVRKMGWYAEDARLSNIHFADFSLSGGCFPILLIKFTNIYMIKKKNDQILLWVIKLVKFK